MGKKSNCGKPKFRLFNIILAQGSGQGAKRVLWHRDNVPNVHPVHRELVSSLSHGHPSEPLVFVQEGQGLILAYGPAWHQNRRVCSHAFHKATHLGGKCINNHLKGQNLKSIRTPLPPSQEDARQSARVRRGEQQGEPQGGDQGRGSTKDQKHSHLNIYE